MKSTRVDPRYASEEMENPFYRVDFWGAVNLRDRDKNSLVSDEYLITEATGIDEVIRWAEHEAQGREIVIYAVYPRFEPGHSLIRLLGTPRA
jgi:hypothetical protein